MPEPVVETDDRPDEEILADLGLKHPDQLEAGDDIRGFMQVAVPDRLRRMALRQLWRSNPDLAVLDGLVEYGEDYTDAATVIANLQTAYKVGKGMLADEDEEPAVPEEDEAAPLAMEETDEETDPEPEELAAAEQEVAEKASIDDENPPDSGPTRRRMAFTFEA